MTRAKASSHKEDSIFFYFVSFRHFTILETNRNLENFFWREWGEGKTSNTEIINLKKKKNLTISKI